MKYKVYDVVDVRESRTHEIQNFQIKSISNNMSSEELKEEESTSAPVRRSSRRRVSNAKQARHAALSELRSALTGKAQRIEQFELEEEEDVYDVVTEDQYKELVNQRRKENVCV